MDLLLLLNNNGETTIYEYQRRTKSKLRKKKEYEIKNIEPKPDVKVITKNTDK